MGAKNFNNLSLFFIFLAYEIELCYQSKTNKGVSYSSLLVLRPWSNYHIYLSCSLALLVVVAQFLTANLFDNAKDTMVLLKDAPFEIMQLLRLARAWAARKQTQE